MIVILAEDTLLVGPNTPVFNKNYHKYLYCADDFSEYPIIPNRPYWPEISKDRKEVFYRYLNDDIHEWFKSYSASYKIVHNEYYKNKEKYVQWCLNIEDNDIAILFKLTWGGEY